MMIFFSIISILNTQSILNSIQTGINFTDMHFIISLIIYPLIMILSEGVTQYIQYLSSKYSDVVNYKFSVKILAIIKQQDLEKFEDSDFYDLMQRAEYAGRVYPYKILMSILSVITQVITLFSFLSILVRWRFWVLGLIIIFPLLSSVQMARIASTEYQVLDNRTKYERKSWYFAYLLNKDINIKETKLFSLENYFFGKLLYG